MEAECPFCVWYVKTLSTWVDVNFYRVQSEFVVLNASVDLAFLPRLAKISSVGPRVEFTMECSFIESTIRNWEFQKVKTHVMTFWNIISEFLYQFPIFNLILFYCDGLYVTTEVHFLSKLKLFHASRTNEIKVSSVTGS